MTDWAAKVLEGVPRLALETTANGEQIIVCNDGPFIRYNHALAAIAKLAEGDGLVERLHIRHGKTNAPWEDGWTYSVSDGFIVHKRGPAAMTFSLEVGLQEFVAATSANAAAHIAALTAQVGVLETALTKIDVGEGWAAITARAALKEAGRK